MASKGWRRGCVSVSGQRGCQGEVGEWGGRALEGGVCRGVMG